MRCVYLSHLFLFLAALIWLSPPARAQVAAGDVIWQRELGPALTESKRSGRVILALICDANSAPSQQAWATLYRPEIVDLLQDQTVPLLVDRNSQAALARQLGVTEPGTVILYDRRGTAVRKFTPQEMQNPAPLRQALQAVSGSTKAPAADGAANPPPSLASTLPGAPGADPSAPAVGPASASTAPSAPPATSAGAGAPAATTTTEADFSAGAVPAEQVVREQLGQELTVTGNIMVFEPSNGPRFPFILTLTTRAQDPVQIVYWEQAAEKIHQGRALPKRGDKVTAKGKLTDYRGRLQIKVDDPAQIRFGE